MRRRLWIGVVLVTLALLAPAGVRAFKVPDLCDACWSGMPDWYCRYVMGC